MLIKVRVWNGEQFISPDFIDRNGIAHWKENSMPESSSETELFTGLPDKNGVEIYEGDKYKWGQETGKIIFENGCFGCVSDRTFYSLKSMSGELEVVGNIHEQNK